MLLNHLLRQSRLVRACVTLTLALLLLGVTVTMIARHSPAAARVHQPLTLADRLAEAGTQNDVPLTSGSQFVGTLDAAPSGACTVFLIPQYFIQVPAGASRLQLLLVSNRNIQLYTRANNRIGVSSTGDLIWDYRSSPVGQIGIITISPSSPLPLQTGSYYLAVANCSSSSGAFGLSATVTVPGCPLVSSISPNTGPVGSSVVITGSDFTGVSSVKFDSGVAANFTINNSTQITATVPNGAITGPLTISKPDCPNQQSFTFTVTGCSYSITPTSQNFTANGGPGTVNVVAGTGCAWTATSQASFLTINSGSSGSGNGTVNYTVAANTSAGPRTGTITITGQTFTVNQAGVECHTVTGINPTSGNVGSTATITGTNFTGVTSVRFTNNVTAQFTIVSATSITATVPAGAVSGPITIGKPNCNDVQTGTFTVAPTLNPVPTLAQLNPNTATTGGNGFTLTLTGTNFINGSVVRWNGNNRTTTFAGGTQLTAAIPASDLATAGTANVTVFNPAPGGGLSGALTFSISQNPRIVRVVPTNAAAGSPVSVPVELAAQGNENGVSFSLTFDPALLSNPQAMLGTGASGAALTLNATQAAQGRLGVIVNQPPGQVFAAGVRQILAVSFNAAAVSAATSTNVGFGDQPAAREVTDANANVLPALFTPGAVSIVASNLPPTLTQISPNSTQAGGVGLTLNVTGMNFINGSVVRWNGADRSTTFVGATQLTAAIPATDIANVGTAQVTVFTPAPGGGTSSALTFTINGALANVSAASFSGAMLAPDSLVTAFGAGLATGTAAAPAGQPLPTELLGTSVRVRDAAGMERSAQLIFVAPMQINYVLPMSTALGNATVTVTAGNGRLSIGTVMISAVAPGLFSFNGDGQGVVAATALRVRSDGTQSFETVARFDQATNRFVAAPIDLGPAGEQVFLIAFGTGFRLRTSLAAVNVRLGGTDAEVLFAGAAPGLIGVDQLNTRIPRSLAGRGEVEIGLTVDGKAANSVRLNVR